MQFAMCAQMLTAFFLVAIAASATSAPANNVCPTWWDYWVTRFNSRCKFNDDIYLELPAMSKKYGFPIEEHNVTTEDGYILRLYRIKSNDPSATPVLVVHGIYQNALGWFSQGNNSLAYVLARRKFDVWAVNLRGTKYSSGHINASISEHAFWDFSAHELGTKDYRAVVKYVYGVNNERKIRSVNFSLGSTAALIYASSFPSEAHEYLERVVSLAPVGYLRKTTSILGWLQVFWYPAKWVHTKLGTNYILKPTDGALFPKLAFLLTPLHMRFYRFVMGLVFGFDMDQFNPWTLPIVVSRSGDAIGVNIIEHYVQIIRRDVFAAMDYWSKELNIAHYGSETPPIYNLTAIQVPFTFIHGLNDALATPANVKKTFKELPITGKNHLIALNYTLFNHQDFVIAKDANTMLYGPLADTWLKM